jgi:hypothetical protein
MDTDGLIDGDLLGEAEGEAEGDILALGLTEGDSLGDNEGEALLLMLGDIEGDSDCPAALTLGEIEGLIDGDIEGLADRTPANISIQ